MSLGGASPRKREKAWEGGYTEGASVSGGHSSSPGDSHAFFQITQLCILSSQSGCVISATQIHESRMWCVVWVWVWGVGMYYACTCVMCLCSMCAHIALYVVYVCTVYNVWACAVCMCVACGMYTMYMCSVRDVCSVRGVVYCVFV